MKTAKQINADLAYMFKKINWAASSLDAKAIQVMNTVGKDILELDKKKK